MDAIVTLLDLRQAGYTVTVADGKLKLRGPGPPEELESSILANRDEIKRLIIEDIIVDELEVFDRAREHFGLDEEGGAA